MKGPGSCSGSMNIACVKLPKLEPPHRKPHNLRTNDIAQSTLLHPHSWPPAILWVKDMPPQAHSAHMQTPFQRLCINYVHRLQKTYQFAALDIPTSKHCVHTENGKLLRRQMNAPALMCGRDAQNRNLYSATSLTV